MPADPGRSPAVLLLLLPLQGLRAECPSASARQREPQLSFAHGGNADFRGRSSQFYCLLSAPGLAINVKTEGITSPPISPIGASGSVATEVHLVARVSAPWRTVTASVRGMQLGASSGGHALYGACGDRPFDIQGGEAYTCGELSVERASSNATLAFGSWRAIISAHREGGHASRLSVTLQGREDADAHILPHGLLGQSFSTPLLQHGRLDVYPTAGRFTSPPGTEGGIEGTVADYKVSSAYATGFVFSRFDAQRANASASAALLDARSEATAAEAAGAARLEASFDPVRAPTESQMPCPLVLPRRSFIKVNFTGRVSELLGRGGLRSASAQGDEVATADGLSPARHMS